MPLPIDDEYGGGDMIDPRPNKPPPRPSQSSPSSSSSSYSTSALLGLNTSTSSSSSSQSSTPAPPSWLVQAPQPADPVAPEPPSFLENILDQIKERARREPKKVLDDTANELGMTAGALTTVPGVDPTLRRDRGRRPQDRGDRRQRALDAILGALAPPQTDRRDPITGRKLDLTPDPVTLEDPTPDATFSDELMQGPRTGGFKTDPETGEKIYFVKPKLDNVVHANETTQLQNINGQLQEVPYSSPVNSPHPDVIDRLEERDARSRVLRRSQPIDKKTGQRERHGDVKPLTWDEYAALTDRQRAAVDFNTMLVQAVRKDKRMQDEYNPSEDEQAAYDRRIDLTFGSDGGSKRFAPETMSVLQQVGYEDESMDLDDFLGLRAAITSRDIRNFGQIQEQAGTQSSHRASDNLVGVDSGLSPAAEVRNDIVTELVDGTVNFQEQLAEGEQMLQNFRATAMLDRNQHLEFYGGVNNEPQAGFGWQPLGESDFINGVPQNDNAYFQYAFEQLATANPVNPITGESLTKEQLVTVINQDLANRNVPGLLDKFWGYVDRRSSQSYQGGKPLGIAEGTEYRTPEEFRRLLGLEPKEERHARRQ